IMAAFKLSPSPDAERLIMGLRAVAVLGLVGIPLNHAVLKRLLAIVITVRAGDPFVAANAYRLQAIAWALLALQLLSLVIGAIANLSILKTGKARAIRFSTLDAICEALSCQPGDILRFEPEHAERRPAAASKRGASR